MFNIVCFCNMYDCLITTEAKKQKQTKNKKAVTIHETTLSECKLILTLDGAVDLRNIRLT